VADLYLTLSGVSARLLSVFSVNLITLEIASRMSSYALNLALIASYISRTVRRASSAGDMESCEVGEFRSCFIEVGRYRRR